MSTFKLILNIVWAIVKFCCRKGESKANEVQVVKKEIGNAFKEKDKRKKAARINSIINHINSM